MKIKKILSLILASFLFFTSVPFAIGQEPSGDNYASQLSENAEKLRSNGEFREALNSLEKLSGVLHSNQDWHNLAGTYSNLGILYLEVGEATQAFKRWEFAEFYYRKVNDPENAIKTILYQSKALQASGLYSQSCKVLFRGIAPASNFTCEDFDRSFKSDRESEYNWEKIVLEVSKYPAETQISMWRELGDILRSMGQLEYSERSLRLGLAKLTTIDDNPLDSFDLLIRLSLAHTLKAKGDLEKQRISATTYKYSSPWIYSLEPQNEKADNKYQVEYNNAIQEYQAVSFNSFDDRIALEADLSQLSLLNQINKRTEARNLWIKIKKKLELDDSISFKSLQSTALPIGSSSTFLKINLARDLSKLKSQWPELIEWREILDLLENNIESSGKINNSQLSSYTYGNMGSFQEYCYARDDKCGLTDTNKHAIFYTQKALMYSQVSSILDLSYQWNWQLARIYKSQGERKLAESNYKSAISKANKIRDSLLTLNLDVQFSFRDRIDPLFRELVAFEVSSPDGFYIDDVVSSINSLQLFELASYANCKLSETASLQYLQSPNSAVFYVVQDSENTNIFYRLRDKSQSKRKLSFRIPNKKFNSVVDSLRKALVDDLATDDVIPLSAQLYDWIIRPAEKELEKFSIKDLIYVMDGPIRNIPMAILYDQKLEKYVIDKDYTTTILPGLDIFTSQQEITSNVPDRKRIRVLLGGNDFKDRSKSRGNLEEIRELKKELETVAKITNSPKPLMNEEFTEENIMKNLATRDFSAIHFKTHGEFSSDPDKNFLVAYDGKTIKGKDFSRIISMGSGNKVTPLDLIVLSACKSAKGDKRAILGLAGIAVKAGAKSALSTGWKVDDSVTTDFMTHFYQELSIQGTTKAQAILKAQRALRDNDAREPHEWGAYMLVGNWL
jgi:CHAT domain-containing protein